jgi:hypothetical protein
MGAVSALLTAASLTLGFGATVRRMQPPDAGVSGSFTAVEEVDRRFEDALRVGVVDEV